MGKKDIFAAMEKNSVSKAFHHIGLKPVMEGFWLQELCGASSETAGISLETRDQETFLRLLSRRKK